MHLGNRPIIYVTRDIERAMWAGWEECENYFVVTAASPYATWWQEHCKIHGCGERLLVVPDSAMSSYDLLCRPDVRAFISQAALRTVRRAKPYILLFEPSDRDAAVCKEQGWQLLNPFMRVFAKVEQKIAQVRFLKKAGVRTPPTMTGTLENVQKKKIFFPCVLQYNLGHTGEGTLFIEHQEQLHHMVQQFPKRLVRITRYLHGFPMTVNCVIGKKVYVSAPSVQITGIPLLTPHRFATVGTDWDCGAAILGATGRRAIQRIAHAIGRELAKMRFRGGFGIDFVRDTQGRLFVIEVNARQVASMVYESYLQSKETRNKKQETRNNTMLLHIQALLGIDDPKTTLPEKLSGSQIFVRAQEAGIQAHEILTHTIRGVEIFSQKAKGANVRKNEDILRLRFPYGILESRRDDMTQLSRAALQIIRNQKKNV